MFFIHTMPHIFAFQFSNKANGTQAHRSSITKCTPNWLNYEMRTFLKCSDILRNEFYGHNNYQLNYSIWDADSEIKLSPSMLKHTSKNVVIVASWTISNQYKNFRELWCRFCITLTPKSINVNKISYPKF